MIDVGSIDSFPEGVGKVVSANARSLVIVKWRGDVYALRNVCPHQTQSFLSGVAHARLGSARVQGELSLDPDNPVFRCPVHGFQFGLKDGRCASDPGLRVRAYRTELRDDRVLVDVGGRGDA
jgi:nitrite reductase/ring-hydroxylating ferredoxin subunit